jgi:hypothetical protein
MKANASKVINRKERAPVMNNRETIAITAQMASLNNEIAA